MQDRRRDVQSRERRLKVAMDRDASWQADWSAACAGCWFGQSGTLPSVGTVREILSALVDLSPVLERRASLTDRIQKMQADQQAFAAEALALARSLNWDTGDMTPLELAQRIARAINDASTALTLRRNKTSEGNGRSSWKSGRRQVARKQ